MYIGIAIVLIVLYCLYQNFCKSEDHEEIRPMRVSDQFSRYSGYGSNSLM